MKTVALEEELLETMYQIKLTKNKVTFIWSSTPQTPLKSSIDLETRINPKEILIIAKKFNTSVKGDRILVQNLEVYNRLLIYACVRPSLKNAESIQRLRDKIFSMASWDALYWSSAFRELWWTYGKYMKLRNMIKAFKLFFEI